MDNNTNHRDLDQTDEILNPDLPDEALEAAAEMGKGFPTASINILPPNCC